MEAQFEVPEDVTGFNPNRVLRDAVAPRHIFDPTSKEDRVAYLVFLKTNRWIKKYKIEAPALTVPATVERKLLAHLLRGLEAQAEAVIAKQFAADRMN